MLLFVDSDWARAEGLVENGSGPIRTFGCSRIICLPCNGIRGMTGFSFPTPRHPVPRLILGADVVGVPYGIRWAAGQAVVGYRDPEPRIGAPLPWRPWRWYHRCAVLGMGCTMLDPASVRLPSTGFYTSTALGITGEDVGFCLAAERSGARIWACVCTTGPPHHMG